MRVCIMSSDEEAVRGAVRRYGQTCSDVRVARELETLVWQVHCDANPSVRRVTLCEGRA